MNIILLSGGSGKRLWPLSNEVRSKQFLKILRGPDGVHESMLQYIYRNLSTLSVSSTADDTGFTADSSVSAQTSQTTVGNKSREEFVPSGNQENGQQDRHGQQERQRPVEITIATSANQVSSIRSQLGDEVGISIEPCRRDTFPAIALATAYLHDVRGVGRDEAVVVCPVDPYVEPSYFKVIADMYDLASGDSMAASKAGKEETGIVLMGIAPTYPSAKYGYIIPASTENVSAVKEFKEKPDVPTAEKYISLGAMWNGGVFAFKLSYLLEKSQSLLGYSSYNDLLSNYAALPKISFDYAVVEKEPNVTVIKYAGAWKDLGTWNTLTEAMSEPVSGNATAPLSVNTHVINELQIPLIALGVRDLAIAATPDGILITDKKSSDKLKDYVAENRPMYEKRLWGEYKVLDMFASSLPAAMTADSVSSPAHGSETADKVGVSNPVNNCVYTHSEAGDNAGKDMSVGATNTAEFSSNGVQTAQAPVDNSTGEKVPFRQESCPNIQTINGAAEKINTVNPVVINTDETAMAGSVAGTVSCCNSLTKHLIIKPGEHISYQLHRHRSEVWTFIAGRGLLLLGDEVKEVSVGDVVKIAAGVKHGIQAIPPSTLSAPSTATTAENKNGETTGLNVSDCALHIIEVQIGDELTEEDIERFDWPLSSGLATTVGTEDVSSVGLSAASVAVQTGKNQ